MPLPYLLKLLQSKVNMLPLQVYTRSLSSSDLTLIALMLHGTIDEINSWYDNASEQETVSVIALISTFMDNMLTREEQVIEQTLASTTNYHLAKVALESFYQ